MVLAAMMKPYTDSIMAACGALVTSANVAPALLTMMVSEMFAASRLSPIMAHVHR